METTISDKHKNKIKYITNKIKKKQNKKKIKKKTKNIKIKKRNHNLVTFMPLILDNVNNETHLIHLQRTE